MLLLLLPKVIGDVTFNWNYYLFNPLNKCTLLYVTIFPRTRTPFPEKKVSSFSHFVTWFFHKRLHDVTKCRVNPFPKKNPLTHPIWESSSSIHRPSVRSEFGVWLQDWRKVLDASEPVSPVFGITRMNIRKQVIPSIHPSGRRRPWPRARVSCTRWIVLEAHSLCFVINRIDHLRRGISSVLLVCLYIPLREQEKLVSWNSGLNFFVHWLPPSRRRSLLYLMGDDHRTRSRWCATLTLALTPTGKYLAPAARVENSILRSGPTNHRR